MDFYTRVSLDTLEPGDIVMFKDYHFEVVKVEEKNERSYWLYAKFLHNGLEYRYPWPKSANIRLVKKKE